MNDATFEHTRAVWTWLSPRASGVRVQYPGSWHADIQRLHDLGYVAKKGLEVRVLVPLLTLPESAMKPWKEEANA